MTTKELDREEVRLDRLVAELGIPQQFYVEPEPTVPFLKREMPPYFMALLMLMPLWAIPVGQSILAKIPWLS